MTETTENTPQRPEGQETPRASGARPSAEAPRPSYGSSGQDRGDRGPRPRYGGDRGDRGDRGERGGRRGGFRPRRRKVCAFCVDKITHIDYKEHQRLHNFVSDRGKILKSRQTGTCAKHQRALSQAIKRARHIALLPYVAE
jgi:small subunit ribosomal protein S18